MKSLTILLSLFLLGAVCGGDEKTAHGKEVVLRLGHVVSRSNPWHIAAEKFAETVREASGGTLRVYITSDGKLGGEKELAESLRDGELDFAVVGAGTAAQLYPKLNVLSLPYLFRDRKHLNSVITGEIGDELLRGMSGAVKIRGLAFWERGPRYLTNSVRPIYRVKDVQDLKIRVPAENLAVATWTALGAKPVPLPFEETYFALHHGIADGQENPISLIVSSKFFEVQKYLALTEHGFAPALFAASELRLERFAPETQEIFSKAAKLSAAFEAELVRNEEHALLTFVEKNGMILTRPSKDGFAKALKGIRSEFLRLHGTELYERIQACP